jgi:hypothetical protein
VEELRGPPLEEVVNGISIWLRVVQLTPSCSVRLLSLHSLNAAHNPITTLSPDDSWGCGYLQVSITAFLFFLT